MYNLIKNNLIQFDRLIIEQYYKLGIDEVDTIILIRLNDLLRKNNHILNDELLAESMKINKNELGKRIVNLVKNGFITLELSTIDSKEIFNLDETYKRLALILSGSNEKKKEESFKQQIKDTVELLEKELKKILSPLELEMVQRWYIDDKYCEDEISDAILKTLKYKNRGVTYIDRLLQANRRNQIVEVQKANGATGDNIQELFNRIYARSK
ncbi:MAG: DnaD domain protein [Bacilli bacterium]|nr:DnaD domain protein [Bacilli bacterium]